MVKHLGMSMLKNKWNTALCCKNNCENCKGIRCTHEFLNRIINSIATMQGSKSDYIISNGSLLIENLEYKKIPEDTLIDMLALLMIQCSECKEHDDNCFIYLGMMGIKFALFKSKEPISSEDMPFSIIKHISSKSKRIGDKLGQRFFEVKKELWNEVINDESKVLKLYSLG